ncbi:MAG: hypothetical protein WBW31_11765 [Candidatus Sulfotelmatobacter sp.]|jgi:hypothetical protein
MDSEEIQQERVLPGFGQTETAQSDAAAIFSPGAEPCLPLSDDLVLALLERRDLPVETLEQLGQNPAALKSRKVCVALAAHPRTPRHMALRLLRHFYTGDLMQFGLRPSVAADLKHFAAEQLVTRLPSVTLGERLMLARRASETVAAALLLDKEPRVAHTALENARLTEAAVTRAVLRPNGGAAFVEAVCHHPKWSLRREIRVALLRSPHTPLARALEFSRGLPPPLLRDILHTSRLPEKMKAYLRENLKERSREVSARTNVTARRRPPK